MPDTPRRAPTPFECFQAGMFHGLMAERRDVRSYTADEIRDGFAGWLEERAADDPRPGVPEVEADPGERRSLSIGDLFPGPEHRYYDAERIEALREPLSWGVMPSVTVMDLLELVCDWQSLTARLAAGATATPEPGGLVLGAEDRFHLWARLFGIQQEAKSGQFGTPSQHITLDHIYEEVTLALDYFEAGPRPAPAAASPERRSPNIDRLMRAGILADLDAERPGQDNEALADELIAFAKAEGRRIAAASPEPDEDDEPTKREILTCFQGLGAGDRVRMLHRPGLGDIARSDAPPHEQLKEAVAVIDHEGLGSSLLAFAADLDGWPPAASPGDGEQRATDDITEAGLPGSAVSGTPREPTAAASPTAGEVPDAFDLVAAAQAEQEAIDARLSGGLVPSERERLQGRHAWLDEVADWLNDQAPNAMRPNAAGEVPEELRGLADEIAEVTEARREVERNFDHGMISPGKYVGHMPDERYEEAIAKILSACRSLLTPEATGEPT